MGRISKYTIEEKANAIFDYKNGKRGTAQICNELGLSYTELYKWIRIYDKRGEKGLLKRERNKTYSKEFKEQVVFAYLNGEGSHDILSIKYTIPSPTTL